MAQTRHLLVFFPVETHTLDCTQNRHFTTSAANKKPEVCTLAIPLYHHIYHSISHLTCSPRHHYHSISHLTCSHRHHYSISHLKCSHGPHQHRNSHLTCSHVHNYYNSTHLTSLHGHNYHSTYMYLHSTGAIRLSTSMAVVYLDDMIVAGHAAEYQSMLCTTAHESG